MRAIHLLSVRDLSFFTLFSVLGTLSCARSQLGANTSSDNKTPTSAHSESKTKRKQDRSPLASVAPTSEGWYDAGPLLQSLRPEERIHTAERAGLRYLEQLPLYDLFISTDADAGTFDVKQDVYFTNREASSLPTIEFRIHANPDQNAAPVRLRNGNCNETPCSVVQGPASVITVKFDDPLPAEGRVRLHFELAGLLARVKAEETGLFAQSLASLMAMGSAPKHSTYGLLSVCDDFLSMANFFPILSRRETGQWKQPENSSVGDFGSDDLFHVRAQVDVSPTAHIATPGKTVRSTLVSTKDGLRRRYNVAGSMVRDFPLFVGENVDVVEAKANDVTIRSMVRDGNRDAGRRVADIAKQSLTIFERRFGPYPYTELDVVEAPLVGGAGGVEFSGLISVASMLYTPFAKKDSLAALLSTMRNLSSGAVGDILDGMLEFTTVHEVSHQWWHTLIGSDSRAHPYVDESLAQYSTLIYLEDRYGVQKAKKAAETYVRLNYLAMRLMGLSDGAVDRPASSFKPTAYAGLVYGKGPFFYREARSELSDAVFFDALRQYADNNRFRTATPRGPVPFLAVGEKAGTIEALAQRWFQQTHGDEDLGPIDTSSVLSSVLGTDSAKLSPQVEEVLRLLGTLTRSPSGGKGTQNLTQNPSEVMRKLHKMLDSF